MPGQDYRQTPDAAPTVDAAPPTVADAEEGNAYAVAQLLAEPAAQGATNASTGWAWLDGLLADDPPAQVAQKGLAGPFQQVLDELDEENATEIHDRISQLPDAEQAEAIRNLGQHEFDLLAKKLPADQRGDLLEPLMEVTTDPKRKAELWKEYHKSQATSQIGEKIAGLDPVADATEIATLQRALASELAEADEEATHFANDPNADFASMRDRKAKELDVEVRHGINLTNDGDDAIAKMGGKPRTRRVWETKELDWFDKELPKIPAEHRHGVTEFRRASQEYAKDDKGAWQKAGARAQHWPDSGVIEIFDNGVTAPGALVHEIGHNVDKNHPDARAAYDKAVGWQEHGSRGGLEAELAKKGLTPADIKTKLDALEATPKVGGYGTRSVEIDGKVYEIETDDGKGGLTYRSYNADAIPGRDVTQRTTDGWHDEWDYARTGPADLFAEHYKLAARDPVRLYQDMIDGPQKKLADLKANGGSTADIAAAQEQVDTLKGQWDIMRGQVNGVTDEAVKGAAAGLPPEQQAAFEAQAQRCCTPDQLQKLARAYQDGDQVDASLVDGVKGLVPKDQQAKFLEEAKHCFTADQLAKLAGGYADGKRKDGKWKAGLKGEDTMLGT